MDAAQCLATLKALGAEAAVVSDIVMDPAWRRDMKAVQDCAAATTANAFRDDAPRRAARARACQWLRNKVAPEFGAVLGVGVANTAISGGSAGGMGLINTDLGVGLPARESRLRSNLRAGDSVTVNQQFVPSSQGRSRAAKGGQRMVF